MTIQGLFLTDGTARRRPEDKTEVAKALLEGGAGLFFERYTMHDPYEGPASDVPVGMAIEFAGPDPRIRRNWYGTAVRGPDGWSVE